MSAAKRPAREAWRTEAPEILRAVAGGLEGMADALEQDDDILGAIAGMGLAMNLPGLPQHIRHTFTEYLSDEAAAAARQERLYEDHMASVWEARAASFAAPSGATCSGGGEGRMSVRQNQPDAGGEPHVHG